MPLSRRMIDAGEDSHDWKFKSDSESWQDEEPFITVPALLPVPSTIPKPNDALCDVCKALELTPRRFVVIPGDPDAAKNEPDNDNIKLGPVRDIKKKSNCPFCRLVLKALSNGDVPEVEDEEPVVISMSWNTDGPRPNPDQPLDYIPKIRILSVYARKQSGDVIALRYGEMNMFPEITLLANDSPTPWKSDFARLIDDQIDFNMVRNWLAMCLAGHGDSCNQSTMFDHEIKDPVTEIPSFRLLDVINNCVIPAPRNCKYVALSYVWGKIDISTILRLLKDNVTELEKPGSLKREEYHEKIPRTIRDAMEVVRRLELQYLWTDSLCIIQDDDSETGSKMDAISKMNLVYGAAHITIIAATGIDANAGLPGLYPGTREFTQPVEEIGPGFRLAFKPNTQDYIHGSVHHTRAWTFQENMFAIRKLMFIGGQVVFSCRKAGSWREDRVFEGQLIKSHGIISTSDEDSNDIGKFEGLIATYSGLSLSFHTDIYNAFAGIMHYMKTELQVTLCHGIPDKYFDWFLIWTPQDPQTRRKDTPSWSWSGWVGSSRLRIWDWYSRSIIDVRRAQRKRTWIIWYQRRAHGSEECDRVWNEKSDPTSPSRQPKNFYGGHVQDRFAPLDCRQTAPTPRTLSEANPPTYIKDAYHFKPGSGFLQFWTVSAAFNVAEATSQVPKLEMPLNGYTRLGIFGQQGREVGIIFVNPDWCKDHVPKNHEFILLCEARDKRAQNDKPDDEPGWRYMVMLIEWHPSEKWAERVAVGWIKKKHLKRALGNGAVWKEIVLG